MLQDRLIQAAIDQFGDCGFEGASTRVIARASATAMSSITYHFGGKQGLYLAVADHIAAQIRQRMAPLLEQMRPPAGGVPTRDAAIEQLLALLDGFAQMMLRPESEGWAKFISREQQRPTEAFERLYRGAMEAIIEGGIALLAVIRPDLGERELRATAVLLMGQGLVLRMGRASVSRTMQVATLDEGTGRLLRARLRANALCILAEGADG